MAFTDEPDDRKLDYGRLADDDFLDVGDDIMGQLPYFRQISNYHVPPLKPLTTRESILLNPRAAEAELEEKLNPEE